ncbi:hypothetical protein VNO77_02429 [Canavalia gladiata]|uniref:Uncharacterized protein n=1 Tax=Canavalia gladiata TaxID=3824 RepID=A0AAN9MTS8_CANGL
MNPDFVWLNTGKPTDAGLIEVQNQHGPISNSCGVVSTITNHPILNKQLSPLLPNNWNENEIKSYRRPEFQVLLPKSYDKFGI